MMGRKESDYKERKRGEQLQGRQSTMPIAKAPPKC